MKILKPGEEGYGYLVEYDSGYISPELTCENGTCTNANLLREFESSITSPDLYNEDGTLPETVVFVNTTVNGSQPDVRSAIKLTCGTDSTVTVTSSDEIQPPLSAVTVYVIV